jgi:DtxR family Mn-dependent transcriptional regulator
VATSTVEDYLKTILLEEEREPGAAVATGRLATLAEVTPGTVTAMLKTLADGGLVAYEPYAGAQLTAAGRQLALQVLRRHRLVELFLVQVVGLDWSEVHDEAERLEHAVSKRLIERMDEMLDHPAVDPHGDPIPSANLKVRALRHSTLAAAEVGGRYRVARIADQSTEFLRLVERIGLRPGKNVRLAGRDEAADTLEIELARGRRANLGLRAAGKIFVERL